MCGVQGALTKATLAQRELDLVTNVRRGIGRSLCTRTLENGPSTSLPTQLSIFIIFFKLDIFSYRRIMKWKSRAAVLSIICQNMSEIFQTREASSRWNSRSSVPIVRETCVTREIEGNHMRHFRHFPTRYIHNTAFHINHFKKSHLFSFLPINSIKGLYHT